MENSKYYKPDITECHVGLDYELKYGDRWVKNTFGDINSEMYCNELSEVWTEITDNRIRVKYLDKQDIEECGWKYVGSSIDDWYEMEGDFEIGSWTSYKIKMHYGKDLKMYINAVDIGNEERLFQGFIKNKSELKVLMKQIGIV